MDGPLEEFLLFSVFPAEIRIKIWKMSLSSRFIHGGIYEGSKGAFRLTANPYTPAILHTSKGK